MMHHITACQLTSCTRRAHFTSQCHNSHANARDPCILTHSHSPSHVHVAVQGLYAVDLLDGGGQVTPITKGLGKPYHAITWNAGTSELYAAAANGTITVFRQRGF